MSEESNPIKDYLFNYIEKSTTISKLISEQKFDVIIDEIIENCYDKITLMDKKEESVGILATGLLHYLLTNALLNSQRKVEYKGLELDIVIPDVRTLEKDAKMTLLILIPKSSDKKIIDKKISQLNEIQPNKDNIWVVLSEDVSVDSKSFVLSKENNSFSKIIFENELFSLDKTNDLQSIDMSSDSTIQIFSLIGWNFLNCKIFSSIIFLSDDFGIKINSVILASFSSVLMSGITISNSIP